MGFFQFVKTPDINRGIADCRNTEGAVLLDVRTPQEYRVGHIPGSIIIPLQQLDKAIDAYDNKAVPLFVYRHPCRHEGHGAEESGSCLCAAYSSAKDPVNMAGFMIDNIARGILKQWHLKNADALPRDGSVTLLDTRTAGEYKRGHIDGFRNIPVDELRQRLEELDPGKPVYVICQSGLRSYIASRILEGNGFTAYNFSGGFRFYDAVVNDRALIESAYSCGMDQ